MALDLERKVRVSLPRVQSSVGSVGRLLIITPIHLTVGAGGEIDVVEMASQVASRGWSVRVLQFDTTLGNEVSFSREELSRLLGVIDLVDIPVVRATGPIPPVPTLEGFRLILEWIEWSSVVIASSYYFSDMVIRIGAKLRSRPLVLSQSNTLFRGRSPFLRDVAQEVYQHTLGRIVRRTADAVRTCNFDDERIIKAEGQHSTLTVHPGTLNPYTPTDDLEGSKSSRPPTGARFRLLFAGRMTYQKGPDLIAASINLLLGSDSAWAHRLEFRIAGSSSLTLELKKYMESFPNLIVRLGRLQRNELARELASADVFLMPSRYESFGIGAIEAQLLGTPVIGSNIRGLTDIVVSGETGFLVAPRAEDMANAIRRAWHMREETPELWRRLIENSRERAVRVYGPAARKKEIDDLLHLLLSLHGRNQGTRGRTEGS